MRLAALASIALALTGCLRFGYASNSRKVDASTDSGTMDPDGSMSHHDPAAGSGGIGGGMDAAVRGGTGGSIMQGGAGGSTTGVMDAGGLDTGVPDSGSLDSGVADAGAQDSGAVDSGLADAGVQDSGPVDSGVPDPGTTDFQEPKWTEDCPGDPSILFCDDFEGGLGKWTYPVHKRGTTAPSDVIKHSGTYSLQASASASTANAQSQARQGVIALGHRKSGNLWARFFYYLPSSIILTQKFSTGVMSEYEQPWFGFSVLIFPDGGVGIERGLTYRKVDTTTFPRNQWVCIEMHVKIAESGVLEFYMDNSAGAIASLSMNTVPGMGYTSFDMGIHYTDFSSGAVTTYSDDVVLSTRRVGCN